MDNAIEICSPCISSMRNFQMQDWVGLGLLLAVFLVFSLTKLNLFSMSTGVLGQIKKFTEVLEKFKAGKKE